MANNFHVNNNFSNKLQIKLHRTNNEVMHNHKKMILYKDEAKLKLSSQTKEENRENRIT